MNASFTTSKEKTMATNGNHYRKLAIALTAALLAGGVATATVYTDTWTEGAQPATSHNGYITYAYHSGGGIQTMTVNPPADGDEFVFTGGKLSIMNSGSSGSGIATITASRPCKVVFKNDVYARNYKVEAPAAPIPVVTNHFYRNLVGPDYVTVLANGSLDDYEPVSIFQDYKDERNFEIDPTSGRLWLNRAQTLFPYSLVREDGKLSFQYQTPMVDKDGRKLVKVVKAELRQVGADIKMRTLAAYSVYSDASSPIDRGFDVDELWIGSDMEEMPVYQGGDTAGYGVNTVALKYVGATFILRFEGNSTSINTSYAYANARIEVADVSKVNQLGYPDARGGTIAYLDGSHTDFRQYCNAYNSAQSGAVLFATTKPTSSPSVTNTITYKLANYHWKGKAPFVVKGIEGYPMVLEVQSPNFGLPSNSTVTVKYGGIVKLSDTSTTTMFPNGVRGGTCDFIVETGGLLQQNVKWTFGKNTKVTLNGGTLLISSGDNASLQTDLMNLTLRNGALVDVAAARASLPMRIGQSAAPGLTWNVGGEGPSTNNVILDFCSYANYKKATNTFNVAKTGDYDADLVFTRPIRKHTYAPLATNVLRKIGFGTMRLNASYTVPGAVLVDGGTLKFGASGIWGGNSYRTPIFLRGGGLAAARNTSNTLGEVTFAANASISLEEGATLAFPDQSTVTWAASARLDIAIPTDADRQLLGTVKFGNSQRGLTQTQLDAIRLNGKEAVLARDGRVTYRYSGLVVIVK